MERADTLTQYKAVREGIGLIDRSETGKIAIAGKDRFTWLQGMVSNDVSGLAHSQAYGARSACVLDPTGHVLTDLTIVKVRSREDKDYVLFTDLLGLPNDEFLLIDLPHTNIRKILDLFDRYLIMEEVEIKDVSDALGCFSYQGPSAGEGWDVGFKEQHDPLRSSGYSYYRDVSIEPAGRTGSGGFDVYFPIELKAELRQAARAVGVPEIDPEVQEILRVEAGIPLFGLDMDETTLAPEANLMKTHISLTKGCYVGQEIVARIDSRGHTNRAMTGLVFAEGDVPASGDRIFATAADEGAGRRETGRITSVIDASPALQGRPIALGYVRHEHRRPGAKLIVGEADRIAEAVELPFYRRAVPDQEDLYPVEDPD